MKKRLLTLTCLFMLFGVSVYAQRVSGKVTSAVDGAPMPGVSVLVKGTPTGTATDADGMFALDVSNADGVLLFSFIGYVTQEVAVLGKTEVNVSLVEDATQLNEVVITALGIEREAKSLSYAQQTVDGAALTEARDINILNSLSGRAAGVDIKKSSSGAGGSTKVQMRGDKSFPSGGSSQPLFVIDGVPMANNVGGQPGMWGGTDQGDGFSQINPDDIESISVLRGSNASALYGSQGANGVVLITTKKGQQGAAKVEFNTGVTLETVLKKPELQFKYGAVGGAKESWSTTPGDYPSGYVDDWFQTGTNVINSIAISGGTANTSAYFSYGNVTAKGITPSNTYGRNNFTFKQSTKLFNDKLTISSSTMLSAESAHNRMPSGYYLNPLTGLYMFPRSGQPSNVAGYTADGIKDFAYFKDNYAVNLVSRNMDVMNWFVTDHHQSNPYWIINKEPRVDRTHRVIASLDLAYKINDHLDFSVRGNYDYANKSFDQRHSATSNTTNVHPNGSWAYQEYTDELAYTDAILKYNGKAGDFDFNVIAGGSYQKVVYGDGMSVPGDATNGLYYPNEFSLQNLNSNVVVSSTLSSRWIRQSVFANATIGFKEMIYLDLAGRNEWSSTLALTGNESYFYPMVGLSAVISEMVSLPEVMSFAKLRASYTTTAREVPYNVIYPANTPNGTTGSIAFNTRMPFLDAKPELVKSAEFGANLRFFDDNLGLDFTYYDIVSTDQFVTLPAPSGSGFTEQLVNAGKITNKGVEIVLDATPIHSGGFTWKTAVNYSQNINEIVETYPGRESVTFGTGGSEGYQSRFKTGGSFNDIYVLKYKRDAQGRIVLDDNLKPLIKPVAGVDGNTDNYEYAGHLNPDFILGWSNNFSYGNFSLSFMVTGKFGGVAFSQTESMLDGAGVSQRTADARDAGGVAINAVKESDGSAVTTIPAETWYRAIGDRNGIGESYVYDRTNVRLTQLALSYRFPITNSFVKGLTASLVGQNLFIFYMKAPFDPELAMSTNLYSQSLDNFNLPATRTIGLNLKVTF